MLEFGVVGMWLEGWTEWQSERNTHNNSMYCEQHFIFENGSLIVPSFYIVCYFSQQLFKRKHKDTIRTNQMFIPIII